MTPASSDSAEIEAELHAALIDDRVHPGEQRSHLTRLARRRLPLAPGADLDRLVDRVLARVRGLGPLEELLGDEAVTDVLVDGPGRVRIERSGRIEETSIVLDAPTIEHLVQRTIGPLGLRLDRRQPVVDARLPDGSRLCAVLPPVAVDGPYLAIRRFARRPLPLDAFAEPAVVEVLADLVERRANIVVSGGTGAGKTTLLAALADRVEPGERIVIVEEASELRFEGRSAVRLETRTANTEGAGAVDLRALVRTALRLRPDRLVVGEVRGPEAAELVQALNTGHDGSLATVHANGPVGALRRLASLAVGAADGVPYSSVRSQLLAALDAVVHVRRRPDGRRWVEQVLLVEESRGRQLVLDGAPDADGATFDLVAEVSG